MKMLKIISFATLCLCFAAPADAQRRGGKKGKRGGGAAAIIKKLDKDNDGKISKTEAKGTRLEKPFDSVAGKDKLIDKAELEKYLAEHKGKRGRGKGKRGKRGGKKGKRGGKRGKK